MNRPIGSKVAWIIIATVFILATGTVWYIFSSEVNQQISAVEKSTLLISSSTSATSSLVAYQGTAYIKLQVSLPNGGVLSTPSGERVGIDTNGVIYNEVPNASYSTTTDNPYGEILFSEPPQGSYALRIIGASSSSDYSLIAYIAGNKNPVPSDQSFSGDIDNGQVVTYSLNYDPNAVANSTLNRESISAPTAPPTFSSSTAQVGDFTVVTNCNTPPESNIGVTVTSIDISKNNSTTQIISTNFIPELFGCPNVQSQDINFDGYPDFMINTGHGATGNGDFEYWIYNTSTDQFDCPSGTGRFDCGLEGETINFNSASSTITTNSNNGCAGGCTDTQTLQWINGNLTTIKDVSVNEGGPPDFVMTQTTEELINGQMQVVNTSTYLPGAG